jgi:hypothetical protein
MANPQNDEKEKEWRGLKLTPIVEDEDGSNNYSKFSQKATLDLDAAGYWKYVAGPDYNPPIIPDLMPSMQVQGLDAAGTPPRTISNAQDRGRSARTCSVRPWLVTLKRIASRTEVERSESTRRLSAVERTSIWLQKPE